MKPYQVGYTTGVFDLFHVGHLNLLERCKKSCETLIVACCTDAYVQATKGKTPVIPYEERARILAALRCVDRVVPMEETDKLEAYKKYGFDVLFSGDDWKGSERYAKTEAQFAPLGVAIVYFPYTREISTTMIRNRIRERTVGSERSGSGQPETT